LKSKTDASSTNNANENNNDINLFNDSADDEMMLLCSQAIEKEIASGTNCKKVILNTSNLLIDGITPLNDNDNTFNNNVYHHAAKKFKPLQSIPFDDKNNGNVQSRCHTVTSNIEHKQQNHTSDSSIPSVNISTNCNSNTTTNSFSLSLNDSLLSEDDLFSAIDLSAIDEQIKEDAKKTTSTTTLQKLTDCNKQQKNIKMFNANQNKTGVSF